MYHGAAGRWHEPGGDHGRQIEGRSGTGGPDRRARVVHPEPRRGCMTKAVEGEGPVHALGGGAGAAAGEGVLREGLGMSLVPVGYAAWH